MNEWDLTLRTKGRKRFPDAHFKDEDPLVFRLDLFTAETNGDWLQTFGRHGHRNIKEAPRNLFPPLDWILQDKLKTVPMREGPDPADKRAKDLIDVYNLVFNNEENRPARQLLQITDAQARKKVRPYLENAVMTRPEYREALETLAEWLQ